MLWAGFGLRNIFLVGGFAAYGFTFQIVSSPEWAGKVIGSRPLTLKVRRGERYLREVFYCRLMGREKLRSVVAFFTTREGAVPIGFWTNSFKECH